MKLSPNGNRVLIKPNEAIDKSKGGILLPDAAKEKPLKGKVIAKGPGKRMENGSYQIIPMDEGDTVYYSNYAGSTITVEGEELRVIDADDVLAIES